MQYINPFDIAKQIGFDNLNQNTFKKFKRRVFAELELNDDKIIVNNVILYRNEIYSILDEIDKDKSLLDIYRALYENEILNSFLNGSKSNHIEKLKNLIELEDRQTVEFITPYLINILSKIYKKAFLEHDVQTLIIQPPVEEIYYEKIYEPIYKLLKNKENELYKLKNTFDDFYAIKYIIGDVKTINKLPDYFAKIRIDIAQAIRNLSIDSWNESEDLDLALSLIGYALKFKVNQKMKDKFLSDKTDLENISKEQKTIDFLTEIEKIFDNKFIPFPSKVDKTINTVEQKNNEIKNDILALMIYNLVDNYIEKNQLVLTNDIPSLLKIFNYLLKISNDYKLNQVLKDNIETLKVLLENIQKNEEKKYIEYGMYIGGFLGLVGGFTGVLVGLILGAIVGTILGKVAAK